MSWQLARCVSGVRRCKRQTRHLLHCNSTIARPARTRRDSTQLSAQCMRESYLLDDMMTCFKLCAAPHMTQVKRACESKSHNDAATRGQKGGCWPLSSPAATGKYGTGNIARQCNWACLIVSSRGGGNLSLGGECAGEIEARGRIAAQVDLILKMELQ